MYNYKLKLATIFTSPQAINIKNIHKIAYINCIQAFLNSSGFHLADANLIPINTKTQIARTITREKISVFAQVKSPPKIEDVVVQLVHQIFDDVELFNQSYIVWSNQNTLFEINNVIKDVNIYNIFFIFLKLESTDSYIV